MNGGGGAVWPFLPLALGDLVPALTTGVETVLQFCPDTACPRILPPLVFQVLEGTYTKSLVYPHRKKSQGVRSGDRGGQGNIGELFLPARLIKHSGRVSSFRYQRTYQWKWGEAPSCWKTRWGQIFLHLWLKPFCNHVQVGATSDSIFSNR